MLKNISRFAALAFLAWALGAPALAQSGCSSIVYGAVLTAGQWNACFATKQDIGAGASAITVGSTSIITGSSPGILYDNSGKLGILASTGTTGAGNLVFSASPTLSGTIGGALTFSGAHTLSSALTYGGVTLSNAVTGTGNMVLSVSPTFTGTVNGAAATWSGNGTAAAFIPSGSTVPTNGMYLSAANTVSFATNSAIALRISSTRALTITSAAVNPLVVNGGSAGTVIGQLESTGNGAQVGLGYFTKDSDTTANQWFVGVGATVNSSFQMLSGVASDGTGGTNRFTLTAAGALTLSHYGAGTATFDASGNISSVSDERLKNVSIVPFAPGLDVLRQVKLIRYHFNKLSGLDQKNEYAGFSAQNVRRAFGAANADQVTGIDASGYYTLQDRALLAGAYSFLQILDGQTQAQAREIAALKSRVARLQAANDNLRTQESAIEGRVTALEHRKMASVK